jgi:plasmid stability protein
MKSLITMKSLSQNLSVFMASITIRNLDDQVKSQLRIAAARHGCSMEEEVRRILRRTLMTESDKGQFGSRIHQRFTKLGGIDLPEVKRSAPRSAPDFSDPDE